MNEPPVNLNQTLALAVSTANPFAHLRKAHDHLERAKERIAGNNIDAAALEARLAVYHTTHAYIAAKTGKPSRTPRRIHAQFARLATLAHDVPLGLQKFVPVLLKALSLSEEGEAPEASFTETAGAIGNAQAFITLVAASLSMPNERVSDFPEIRFGHG